jgi:hypothetical protein
VVPQSRLDQIKEAIKEIGNKIVTKPNQLAQDLEHSAAEFDRANKISGKNHYYHFRTIILEIPSQLCSSQSWIGCYRVAMEFPI